MLLYAHILPYDQEKVMHPCVNCETVSKPLALAHTVKAEGELCTLTIPSLCRLAQKDQEFESSMAYRFKTLSKET